MGIFRRSIEKYGALTFYSYTLMSTLSQFLFEITSRIFEKEFFLLQTFRDKIKVILQF